MTVTTSYSNPLCHVTVFGQSIWLDYIRRDLLDSGELRRLIQEDGLRGVTVNPSILEKAIRSSSAYDARIHQLLQEHKKPDEIYEALAIEDVQRTADLFRSQYEESNGWHGFVSLEVSPYLAHNTEKTIAEARRLWYELDRPNVMIKVPGTVEGLPAIHHLISEGININVTLLFGLPRYRQVAEAYLKGLEKRVARGQPVEHIASVASFFLSRIDVLIDPLLEKRKNDEPITAWTAEQLRGRVAIASAKLTYEICRKIFTGERAQALLDRGARPQRLLWASTSTKNPTYSDVKYVEALIGPGTINTIPPETLKAYRDHGQPASRLEQGLPEAHKVFEQLRSLGLDIDQLTQQLEDEGVEKFARAYDKIVLTLEQKRDALLPEQATHVSGV